MSYLAGESSKSSSDSTDSPRISPLINKHNNDFIQNSHSTKTICCSPVDSSHHTVDNKTTIKTKREVYKYETNWLVSSLAWSNGESEAFELAIGSFIEDHCNQICIVNLPKDSYDEEIRLNVAFDHPYPPTKISWIPRQQDSNYLLPRLVATSAECLRIWRIPTIEGFESKKQQKFNENNVTKCDSTSEKLHDDVRLECTLSPNEKSGYSSPLTSFDWNDIDSRIIVTSSVDTTCAVWDVEIGTIINRTNPDRISCLLRNQILAHDHEVYDVSFSRQGSGRDVFVTAGGDGSLRQFDLRMLSTSTVLYETSDSSTNTASRMGPALVRVACNKQDANYVGAFSTSSRDLLLIDVRKAGRPLYTLSNHSDSLNGISWAPHSAHHLCSASDDGQALIWGLTNMDELANDPLLAYRADGKVNTISWSSSHPDWIAIGFDNCLELLRV